MSHVSFCFSPWKAFLVCSQQQLSCQESSFCNFSFHLALCFNFLLVVTSQMDYPIGTLRWLKSSLLPPCQIIWWRKSERSLDKIIYEKNISSSGDDSCQEIVLFPEMESFSTLAWPQVLLFVENQEHLPRLQQVFIANNTTITWLVFSKWYKDVAEIS